MKYDNKRRYAAAVMIAPALLVGCGQADTPQANAGATAAAATDKAIRPQGPERLVLAFGDSLYAGYGVGRGQSLPDQVQSRLWAAGINATIVNAGVSGDTTAAGRQRLAFALDNLPRKPDLVMLGLGGNDLLRQIPATETRANLDAMLAELRKRDIPVLLTGMRAPPNLGPDFVGRFDPIWPDLAKRYDAALYPFILDGVIGMPALMQADHVHPTAVGITRIADRVTPLVVEQLATQQR